MDAERASRSLPSGLGPAALSALAVEAWMLEPPAPHERASVVRDEAALLLDGLLVRVARGQGALEVSLGECLCALSLGDRLLRLGYSCLGDYARERLGIGESTGRALSRLADGLRSRPLLRAAVRAGEVSVRKAQAVLAVALGDAEEGWTARARVETVRALEAAVAAGRGSARAREEGWDRIQIALEAGAREALDEALALAGKVLGAGAPVHQRLEAICQEFLGAHPGPAEVADADESAGDPVDAWREAAMAALEEEFGRWEFLVAAEPVPAPGSAAAEGEADPVELDSECRRLASMRRGWDELLGHLAMLLRDLGLWRDMKFASFAHYVTERLGMGPSTLNQRIWLERRLYELPALRDAMRAGRLTYEKARLVARHATAGDLEAWIARAEGSTCIVLRREVDALEQRQMCARRELDLRVPRRVAVLLAAAMRAAREGSDGWLTPSQCLERIARHFVDTWAPLVKTRNTLSRRVLERDRWCQVPGCSRPAVQAHHVRHRAHGGCDHERNLTGLCAAHHLIAVHRGYIRVAGTAPDALTWVLPVRLGDASFPALPGARAA